MTLLSSPDTDLPLKVMAFNVRYGTADDGENSWQHRKDILVDTIDEYDPDVIGMQECLKFQADYIAEKLPRYQWLGIGRDKDGGGERVAVLYDVRKLVPINTGHFWLSETPDQPGSKSWDSSLPRITTWVKFYAHEQDRFFYFFNTHFDHRGEDARLQSAKLMTKRITGLAGDTPVVVTGDFNTAAERTEPWGLFTNAEFRDAWLAAEDQKGPAYTFGGWRPIREDVDRRIDWILTRGPVEVALGETVTYNEKGRFPSDHLPVYAELTIKKP